MKIFAKLTIKSYKEIGHYFGHSLVGRTLLGGRSKIWASQSRGLNFSRRQNHFSRAILGPKNRPFLPNSSFLYFLVGKLKILITKNVKTMKLLGRKMAEKL